MDWVHSESPAPSVHRAVTHKLPTKLIAAHAQFARPIGPLATGADRDHPTSAVHDGQRIMPRKKMSIVINTIHSISLDIWLKEIYPNIANTQIQKFDVK